jgi:hypothetical protein
MKYTPSKMLSNNIIIVDGIGRSGKLLLGTIVSSFSNTEHFEMGRNFEDIAPGIEFKKIKIDYAESFIKNYLNELIYNKYLSRNVNFRASDRTGVNNSQNFKLYKKRLKQKEGNKVINLIKKEKRCFPFVTHDLLLSINAFNKLNIKYKMVYLFRNPFDLVFSWHKKNHGARLNGKDQRMFSLMIERNKKNYPWYNKIFGEYKEYNNIENCANIVFKLNEKTIEKIKKLKKNSMKNIFISTYEKVSENKNNEIKSIAKFLKTKFTKNTHNLIKKERLHPRDQKLYSLNLKKRKKFIELNISKKIYDKLINQEKKFNSNIYNLSFRD